MQLENEMGKVKVEELRLHMSDPSVDTLSHS